MPLPHSEIEKLFEALLDAYRDYSKLQIMVRFKLGENLERFAGRGGLETVIFNLIESVEARGKLERLIVGAYEQNPDNPELKKFYETVFKNFKQRKIVDSDVTSKDFGPNIDWRGKTEEIELQRFFKKQPNWYDVGFLQRIIEQAKSVCRVDLPTLNITATGVLIASKYVLTNYHVLTPNDKNNPELNAKNVRLNFVFFSLNDGRETQSKSFFLNSENPIIASSPVAELDYVLLQLEETFTQAFNSDDRTIKPAQWEANISPSEADSINILQHPNGESMSRIRATFKK
ncbi:MAG: trypsin-like peptidase domain-containing protein [Okeania sp. SIO2D1]|nr:trypsin-like peptidase domain-containing protein [Okeania sp. SIO2D1]